MKRKFALLISLLLTLLVASNIFLFNLGSQRKTVFVVRVIDGDTFESDQGTLRLANINTPEKSEKGYEEAKLFISGFQDSEVQIEELSTDRYGRILARVYTPDYLNLALVRQGLARKFLVHESELSLFDAAEKDAVNSGRGLWKHSPLYDCFEVGIFPSEEILQIENKCGETNMGGFVITDESRKKYKFPDIIFGKITLHTASGVDNSSDLFWGNNGDVWNNDRDTIYILDAEGRLAYHRSYGY